MAGTQEYIKEKTNFLIYYEMTTFTKITLIQEKGILSISNVPNCILSTKMHFIIIK